MSDLSHIDDHAAARALDALPPEEAAQVDRHVAMCPACHRLLREAQETAHLLTLVVQPAQPPCDCKVCVTERIVRDVFRQRSA